MRIAVATRRLIDGSAHAPPVEPIVVAKVLAIGDREFDALYLLTRAPTPAALSGQHELAAEVVSAALAGPINADTAAAAMAAGCIWIAGQYLASRGVIADMILCAARRPARPDRRGYGLVDLIDHMGVGSRAEVVEAVRLGVHPTFAPMVSKRWQGEA